MSKDKYKIALLGGRGYVGQEIIKLLNSHPLFDLSMAFSKSLAEKNVDGYIKNPNLKYTNLSLESLSLPDIDIVICALANGESSVYIDKIEDIDDDEDEQDVLGVTPSNLWRRLLLLTRRLVLDRHRTEVPPSTGRATPVMKPARSDARKAAAWATSQAVPILRPSGTWASRSAITSSLAFPADTRLSTAIGVFMRPGRITLARMP